MLCCLQYNRFQGQKSRQSQRIDSGHRLQTVREQYALTVRQDNTLQIQQRNRRFSHRTEYFFSSLHQMHQAQ